MQDVEIIIVGGGPAGSTCAWKLKEGGKDILLLDRREFPRAKPCAGWITPRVLRRLDLNPSAYPLTLVRFDRLHVHYAGREWKVPTRQYAIRRYEFDRWLLERSGVPVRRHTVRDIRRENGSYVLDGMYRCRYLLGAGGPSCPVYRAIFRDVSPRSAGSHISALESELRGGAGPQECHLWFSEGGLPGYSWYVPKGGGWVSIGIGGKTELLRKSGTTLREHWGRFITKLKDLSFVDEREIRPAAYGYYLREGGLHVHRGNALLVGDAAGLATRDMGEGIGPAVESGVRAARALLRGDRYSVLGITGYSVFDLMFPWRP